MFRKAVHSRLNQAATTMEMLVAISLLALAVTAMGQFVSQVNSGLRDRELSARLGWEIINARELIGTWPIDDITVEQIEQLQVSKPLAKSLTDAKFKAQVVQVEEPLAAIQVTLALECKLGGQSAQPAVLTFWIARESDGDS